MHGLQISASQKLLHMLATEHRNVVSLWRALIYLRRESHTLGPEERRWRQVPEREGDVSPFLIAMQRRGLVERVPGTRGVYRVTAPFAQAYGTDEHDVLSEINPYTVISHYSALVFYGLTLDQPQLITATSGRRLAGYATPLGTDPGRVEGDLPFQPDQPRLG